MQLAIVSIHRAKMKLLLLLLLTVTLCIHQTHQQRTRIARECSDVYRDLGGLRLSGSQHNTEGVVEVCYQSTSQSSLEWGVVCGQNWANENAAVVCRQLGFADQGSTADSVSMMSTTQPYFLESVDCGGFEKTLVDCFANKGSVWCNSSQVAFVTCNLASCNDGAIRVVGGDSETYGRVELCLLGQWGSVQDDDWSVSDATVVCKQLGLDTGGSHSVGALAGIIYGRGTGPVHLNRVQCDESESRLIDCSYSILTVCALCRDVAVQCIGTFVPTTDPSPPPSTTVNVDITTNYQPTNEATTTDSLVASSNAASDSPTQLALVVVCVLLAVSLLIVLTVCIVQTIKHHRLRSTAADTVCDEHPREGFPEAIDMPEYLQLSPAPRATVTMDTGSTNKSHYYDIPLCNVQQEGTDCYENMDMGGVTRQEGNGPYYSVADRGEPRPYEIPTNTLTTRPENSICLVDY